MKRMPVYLSASLLLVVLMSFAPLAAHSQQQQPPSPPRSQPPSGGNRPSTSAQPPNQPNRDFQGPLYVEGRVITDTGQAVPTAVSVRLSCGSTTVQTIKTDSKGYFRFTLGAGTQSNFDFSAADESPSPFGTLSPGSTLGCAHSGIGNLDGSSLTGWEVRISVPGYQPLTHIITDTPSLSTIDVGVLELRSTAHVSPGAVSVTSLLVPNNARKEYEQALKDLENRRLPQAEQHLARAVAAYDKYAAAWNEMGRLYASQREFDKARQSYEKAIAADPKYAPPYVSIGGILLQNRDYEGALASVAKAIQIDPAIEAGIAGYIEAVANYSLDRTDAAETNLVNFEKGPHQNLPQTHAMLADIYLRKNDFAGAAAQIRAYLKEAPQGPFAADLRQKLDEIEKNHADLAGPPLIAP